MNVRVPSEPLWASDAAAVAHVRELFFPERLERMGVDRADPYPVNMILYSPSTC